MMKASINSITGLLIESQSSADDATLVANAVAQGIPAANVQIRTVTDAELNTLIAARTNATLTLAAAQKIAFDAIDAQAGITRLKYITDAPGQEATYIQKAADAEAYKAAGYPFASIANYPWVLAESIAMYGAGCTALQAQAATDGVISAKGVMVIKGAPVEQARRAGKIAAGAATTVAAVHAAQAAAVTALQAL